MSASSRDWTAEVRKQLAWARELAGLGFAVFPVDYPESKYCRGIKDKAQTHNPTDCTDRGKHPACKWSVWSTTDGDLLATPHYFGGREPRNIGIDCDKSSILVLDEDEAGALALFCAERGVELPPTFRVRTAKGEHWYYRLTGDQGRTATAEGGFTGHPINVRARAKPGGKAGGYVVGPGSLHATGVVYEIIDDRDPVPVPAWVLDVIAEKPKRRRRAKARPSDARTSGADDTADDTVDDDGHWWANGPIPAGNRHAAIIACAGWHRRMGHTIAEATPALRDLFSRLEGDRYSWEDVLARVEDVYGRYEAGYRGDERRKGKGPAPPEVGEEFWERSDRLRQLAAFARERYLSPWAVLGCTLAVTAARVGPHVVLPGPPAKASLNISVGLVAPPGGFKTSTLGAVLDEHGAWSGEEIASHEVGTGQGITAVYVRPVTKGEPVQFRETALFHLDEIGSLAAHASQGGANVLPILKSAYSGSRLGAAYADKDRRRPVGRHRYRFVLVAGIQPAHAGVILDDIDGGFPQRWLWLPAIEPDAPETAEGFEPGWNLLPDVPAKLTAQEDDHVEGVRRRREIVLPVCDEAAAEIRRGLDRARRGKTEELEAHARLTRLKFATLLGAWHGRAEVSAWGWETAGLMMQVSDQTRRGVIEHLAAAESAKEKATSKRYAARAVETDQARERRQIVDTARWIAGKVWAEPERWTSTGLRRAGSKVRREWLDDGIDHAVAERWVVEVTESGQGTAQRSLRPGKVKPS